MYSVVLMMAMTSGGDVPAHGWRGGCFGCDGGCHGCQGGCFGFRSHGRHHGCHGCHGGCRGFLGGLFNKHGCHGCQGSNGCYGGNGCHGGYVAPVAGDKVIKKEDKGDDDSGDDDAKMKKDDDDDDSKDESKAAAPAKIIVRLPAKANLTIDGAVTKATSARRTFVSPKLPAGQAFTYTLQAEFNGRVVAKTIQVRAGKTTEVELAAPTGVAAR